MTDLKSLKVGITIGDINGIGPEIILKSLNDRRILTTITPVIYGSDSALIHYKKKMGMTDMDLYTCLLYTSPSPRDQRGSRMPSSA